MRPPKNEMRLIAETHERWMTMRHRKQEDAEYDDTWWASQCGHCQFWIPLSGGLGQDYGACVNATSDFDATIRFEHDGCDSFSAADAWGQADE